MKKHQLLLCVLLTLFSSQWLRADGGGENLSEMTINLCSGESMTWEAYLEMRKCLKEEGVAAPEIDFTSFEVSMVNDTEGAWSSVIDMPLVAAAAAQLPDGKILFWSAKDKFSFGGANGRTWTALFDPATNTTTEALIENTSHDMFCPGINQLPDGRIMVTGGSNSNRTSIYNPLTNDWSSADNMNIARGYHANVTLASGATFLIGGSWSGGVGNKHAEIWSEKSGWFEVPGLTVDAITEGLNSAQPTRHDDYFPWLWTAPNGKVFHAGPNQRMHWIDPTGNGSYTYAGDRGNDEYAVSGTTVMYDVGKILKTGGSNTFEEGTNASSTCYSIDINQDNAIATQVGSMNYPRVYHNSVVLPTGEVVAIGGIATANVFSDNNSALVPEIWSPVTQTWTTLAAMETPRNYHSVGLLLQDGRIAMAGGGLCGGCSTNHADAEIFSPPYLFNANGTLASRPSINSAPTTAAYNSAVNVNVSGSVGSFSMVRLSAVTHSTNNDQRRIPLTYNSLGNNGYTLNIPNRNILPPGSYMLFAMNPNGTPSIAKVIRVGDDINDCTPQNNPDLGGSGLTGTYFNNSDLTAPVLERVDPTIDFNWGTASPDASIGADTYSVRWEGSIKVPRSGTYTFYTSTDDGVRLWVDDKLIVSKWIDQGTTEWKGMIHLEPNVYYDIKMEYYENTGGAVAQLQWSGPGINKSVVPTGNLFDTSNPDLGGTGLTANYFNNMNFTSPALERIDPTIDFDWGGGSPATNMGANTYSIRWEGRIKVPNAGTYTFYSSTDDGVRLWVNGSLIIDKWIDQGTTEWSGTINLSPDVFYDIKMEYYENGGAAVAQLRWSGPGIDKTIIPVGNLFPKEACQTENDPCNDGDACTTGDVYDADCNCIGTFADSDNDGTCNNDDCQPNNPAFPANPGAACNDGDPNTTNDVVTADGCDCAGTPNNGNDPDCNNIVISTQNGSINVSNLDGAPISSLQVFNSSWQQEFNCFADCNSAENLPLPAGEYYVYAKYYTAAYTLICQEVQTVFVGGGGGGPCDNAGGDSDGDGTCNDNDCQPNNPNFPASPGTACNDGDPNTINDVVTSDGCGCAGTPNNGGGNDPDCNNISITAQNGQISVTELDGSPISSLQVFNSTWQQVFNCFADCNPTEALDLPNGDYIVYAKYYSAAYNLICEEVQTVTVSGGSGGGLCDNAGGDSDGDGTCDFDDCQPNDANFPASPGTPCDDGNASTTNDVVTANGCGCLGTTTGGGGIPDCDNDISITTGNGSISVSGLDAAPIASLQIFNSVWAIEYTCYGNCQAAENLSVSAGTYFIKVSYSDANWQQICERLETVNVSQNLAAVEDRFEFEATKQEEHSELYWIHNGGDQVQEYALERSLDGQNFESIYTIESIGGNKMELYQGFDLSPAKGDNYYRVAMHYLDGSTTYSKVQLLNFPDLAHITLFPNPANQFVKADLEDWQTKEDVTITMYNHLGVVVKRFQIDKVSSKYYQMDIRDLREGHYIVWFEVAGVRPRANQLVIGKF